MLMYLLKFSACLAIFMVFYKLFLERETMHKMKRYYLLAVLVLSIGIPLITFVQYVEPLEITDSIVQPMDNFVSYTEIEVVPTPTDYTPIILWTIYGLGLLLFGLKFTLNLFQIFKKIKSNPKFKNQSFVHVLLTDLITPHTFFRYIFLNEQKYEAHEIPQEVFIHEQTHAEQKHSIDVLFIELLQVVFWFNPLLYFIKKDIKLNHEFLADQAVLKNGIQPSAYQTLLLTFSSNVEEPKLANAINYSSIKKRFTVMNTQTSKQKIWIRSFLLLPLVALTLYGFSTKEIIEKEQITNEEYQQKATSEEVAEYNKLAKHYNSQSDDNRVIKLKDMKRLKELYDKMTKEQKSNAEPFPNFPPPPAPAQKKQNPPTQEEIDAYNTWAKKIHSESTTISENATLLPIVHEQDLIKFSEIYNRMSLQQKNQSVKFPFSDLNIKENEQNFPLVPLPPPLAPSPLDVTMSMAKNGAKFMYNGNEITSDEAIALVKKNPTINGKIPITGSGKNIVYLSDELIEVVITDDPQSQLTLDDIISLAKNDAKFYYKKKEITSDEAISIAKDNPGIYSRIGKSTSGTQYVYLSDEKFVDEPIIKMDQDVRVNGKKGDDGMFTFNRKDLKNIKLTVAKGDVVNFKFKIPGQPTQSVEGNSFDQAAKDIIEEAKDKNSIQIILIKNGANLVHAPIFINIID